MAIRLPVENEEIKAYDELQTAELNRVQGGTVTRYNALAPATGFVDVIQHGNMIFLSGDITFQTAGQVLVDIPVALCPKNGFYYSDTVIAGIQISNFGSILGWGTPGVRRLSGCSWSIANK